MGDHGGRAQLSGLLPNVAAGVTRALDAERWSKAEERTTELIVRIQPNWPSEERRNAVASYVRRLIVKCFSCQVFTFGSVPLKTYLPDGDIDLTAFSENQNLKDTWANEVRDVLENEEKNENAEFRVKEVQYIQAEVKLIKCLVEDIVVDISFNQVGGLCTLCFLDEIDTLISQNHLFKRSIILIKAWCYYESRILGAHHGLISTYALETLVLYIFHIYNNSLAGPLEVLYRFLEFFSNFDWENFCVSLWGPVPTGSLPDMIAEPPRKDGGELLLNNDHLDAFSTVYAVLPAGQENQGQTFVSKHFNIIDPLRINNNLGRSVSKGNFFRIRSAFAFGAKRLARLLECPKENLITEVNQFFTNTWDRHGSGNRPDAASPSLWQLQPLKTAPVEESNNSKSISSFKKNSENNVLSVGHEYQADGGLAFHGTTSQVLRTTNQQFQSIYRTSIPPAVYHAQNQKSHGSQINFKVSDHIERNINSRGSADRFQFARTQSSPELTDISAEALARESHNKVQDARKNQIAPTRLDHSGRRMPSRYHLPYQILETADSHSASNSYHDSGEEIASVSEMLEMRQEEQDLVNMMASSRVHNVNAQVQFPINLPSRVSPSLIASIGCNQRNLAGIVPTNFPLIDPSWGSNMQYPQGLVSSPLAHYSPTAGLDLNSEDTIESINGSFGITDTNPDDVDQDFWHEDDAGSSRSNPDSGGFQMIHSDDKKQPTQEGLNFVSSSRACNSGASVIRGHHKLGREHKGPVSEDETAAFQYQTSRRNDIHSTVRNGNMGSFPVSKAISSRSKPASGSSLDGSDKVPKLARDNRGRKLVTSAILTALYGKSKSGWQLEGSSDHNSSQADDEASPNTGNHQSPGCEQAEISGSDSMVPLAPMLVNSSQQRMAVNSGVVHFAFYPTGPPVPYLALLPVYNFPADTGSSDGSTSQLDSDERLDHGHTNPSGENFDSAESLGQSEVHVSSNSLSNATPEPSEEHKSDILNSDFVSHWQNLLYGRSCQNTRHLGHFIYPSSVVAPSVYLQGYFPWDGPGRPLSANLNHFSQNMSYDPRLVPVAPPQSGALRTSVVQRFGDVVPRYRGGTGTYLPKPKVSSRERSSSSTRHHRGNYNHERNDPDREGSWNNSKSRAAGRSHGHAQAEKPGSRPDRLPATDNRADRPWNSRRHESFDMYQAAHNSSVGSTNSSHSSANMARDMYPFPAVSSNGMTPTRPAVRSYDQGVAYGSHAEPLEFDSPGRVRLSSGNEIAQPSDGNPARDGYKQRHGTYRGSSRSSPD